MITAQSSDGVLHQFPDGTDSAVINGVMKNYADANTAPPPDAASEPEKSGAIVGAAKGFLSGLMNSVGSTVSGAGRLAPIAGADLQQESEMGQIAQAAGRGDAKADFSGSDAMQAQIKQGSEQINTAGAAVSDFGNSFTTDEEKGRTSVGISSMLGGLIPVVGATVAGGLPALIGIGGVQGYGEGYDAAKKAGQSDHDAATAGMLTGMVQGGLMAVPVHKALEVMDALPAAAKSSVLKAAVELAKSSGTMVGFSQLSTLADNAVAKATYDPNRDIMQDVGENIGVQAAVGAILPVAGAGLHLASDVTRRAITPDAKTVNTAETVMAAPDIDTAISAAADAAQSTAPIPSDIAAGKDALDQVALDAQQEKLNTLFSGLNTGTVEKAGDDTYNFHPTGSPEDAQPIPLKVWDENAKPVEGEPQPSGDNIISLELAAAQRQHYGDMGIDVVYFQNDPRIPFDGAVDPEQPNTIFLSNDPTRNAAQVAGHEVTHVLENTQLPDGTNLGDLFHRQIAEGLNATGRNYAETVFGSTAPKRNTFDEGIEGDAAHKAAVTQHLIQEIGADIGGEAPKFETFMPKVIDAVQQRYGKSVASDVLRKFLDGIKSAMETLRKFFGSGDGPAATRSQTWVDNLDAIHDTLARMQAERFGTGIERETALLAAQKDRAARDRLAAGQPETSLHDIEENKPIIEAPLSASEKVAETTSAPSVQTGGKDLGPGYAAAKTRAMTYRRWLGELDTKRRAEAADLPQVRLLRENETAILNRVNGVESRLTGTAADRLATVRGQLAAHLNPVGDNSAMARVRAAMVREHQKMADAAVVTKGVQFSPKQQDEKPFFSALTRAVEDLKMEKATPGQWEATIKNMPGIKSEELAWSGLREWLAVQTKPVSKAEVLTHLRENEVQVHEVLKGHKLDTVPNKEETEYAGEPMVDVVDEKGHVFYTGDPEAAAEYIKEGTGGPKQTKFEAHTLPGGENYRELLLTLPRREITTGDIAKKLFGKEMRFLDEDERQQVVEALYKAPSSLDDFKSSHFDETNILAHMRFDDRKTTEPGFAVENVRSKNQSQSFKTREEAEAYQKALPESVRASTKIVDVQIPQKVLHVAEIQSDWHQQGRKQGYAPQSEIEKARLQKAVEDARLAHIAAKEAVISEVTDGKYKTRTEALDAGDQDAYRKIVAEQDDHLSVLKTREAYDRAFEANRAAQNGVPDAPFKTSWHELAFKRILRYAAKHGYARVSWDTGATQADRYDLSKQVGNIDWYKTATDKIYLEVKDRDGDVIFDKPVAREDVADVIGKEHADRIAASGKSKGNFSGEGLKVGGEGMKGFYDKILPNFVNKYVKKWGGKVEDTKLGTVEESKLRRILKEHDYDPDSVGLQEILADNDGRKPVWLSENDLDAIESGNHIDDVSPKKAVVHSVEITPAMRESVMRGQPLFSPRVSEETRDKLIKRNRDYAEMFKTPRTSERKIEVPSKGADSELEDVPKPTFTTNPAKLANEHAAEVSMLEAEGTKAAAAKIAKPTESEVKTEVAPVEGNSSVAERSSKSSATAAAPEEPKTRTLTTKHPEGEGKTIERALNGEETKALENKDQMERASALVDKDPAKALRVAMRKEQPPKDLLPTFVYFELERRATKAGDTDLIEKLRTSPLAKEVTTAARTVQSFATRDPQSAVAKIQEVEQAREAAVSARNPGGLDAAKTVVAAKAEKTLKSAIRAQVVKRLPPLEEMKAFLNSIKCN